MDMLFEKKIIFAGTIKKTAEGLPRSLKTIVPPRGSYVSESVGGKQYFVFNDRKVVCFVSNVFPGEWKARYSGFSVMVS